MRLFFLLTLAIGVAGWAGCARQPAAPAPMSVAKPRPTPAPHPRPAGDAGDAGGAYSATRLTGDYAGYPELERFIDRMVQQHGFSRDYLYGLFSQARRKDWTIKYMNQEKPTTTPRPGGWTRYRAKFLDDRHIAAGADFWAHHASALSRASEVYGVNPEIILGIMGVETLYGANLGTHRTIDALTTLAFDYPRRADYFTGELESLLLLSRQQGQDPSRPVGSFAGAMGLGQFMPSSFLKYAVDFDGDGRKNLWDADDAIGSIANYFAEFGWRAGQPVVSAVEVTGNQVAGLKSGFDTRYTLAELAAYGIRPGSAFPAGEVSLLRLSTVEGDEFEIGYPNFYVITRYNHSTYYAMAVYQLGQAIKRRYQGG